MKIEQHIRNQKDILRVAHLQWPKATEVRQKTFAERRWTTSISVEPHKSFAFCNFFSLPWHNEDFIREVQIIP